MEEYIDDIYKNWGKKIEMARKIEVVDYNPKWKELFKIEEKKIKEILGKNCVAVHHIGSTSVVGLKAKPIIDIMPVVKDISLVDEHNEEFEKLGYECKGEYGIPGRRFYMKGGDNRTHHIHIFEKNNEADIERHLVVRDYLKNHSGIAEQYAELKTELAEKYTYDNEGYCAGKDEFMKKLEQDALEWKNKEEHIGLCMSMGMCFGSCMGMGLLGPLFSNIGIGMCLGISVGMGMGLIVGSIKYKK